MALALTDNLTEWDDADTDNWTGDPTVGLDDTDFFIEGTGAIGIDVDIETQDMFGPTQTATDLSNNYIYMWILSLSATTLQTFANGGVQIGVEDNGGNRSFWNVAGRDTYRGGWKIVTVSTALTPDRTTGGGANLANITNIGVSFTNTAKSKSTQNCFVDWIRYGTGPAYTVTGTTTTAGGAWDEVYSLDNGNTIGGNPAPYGIMISQPGGYALNGPIQIGDTAGTATTDFSAVGTNLAFFDNPIGDAHYGITIGGNTTGTTDVMFGTVVGTGDARQGVGGGSITSAGPAWFFDGDTNIANITSLEMYGARISNAYAGIDFDDGNKTSIISTTFTNCGPVTTGSTNNGAEILSCSFIDPDGLTNNYGLQYDTTPSAGTMVTNVSFCNFITSGTPTTQFMVHFPASADYSVSFNNMKFFGDYTSGTLWHGLNSGTNADITINATSSTVSASEISNTNGGTVTVVSTINYTLSQMKDGTEVRVYTAGTTTEVAGVETLSGGSGTGLNNGTAGGSTDNNSFTFTPSPGDTVDIRIFNLNWIADTQFNLTIPSSDTTVPIQQREDRVFSNP